MARILIIDDNESLCRTMCRYIQLESGNEVECLHTLKEGVERAERGVFDVVFLDVMMPDGNGLEALPAISACVSSPEVIIITGKGERNGAALAMTNGAWDYIQKGDSLETLMLPLRRALQYRREKRSHQPVTVALSRERIVGSSPEIMACLNQVAQTVGSDENVLIQGETGTGKELFARVIHENSRRKNGNFAVLDCAAVPEKLLESTLFGHEKGAFTGADRSRPGVIREADGGTLLLDEVGELPIAFQKAFLRVLQEKTYRTVGGGRQETSDFRVVAATNRDLPALVAEGVFRMDLLYRLNTFLIQLPPLRRRPSDIEEQALHYIRRISERKGIGNKGYSPEFMDALKSYNWPGNTRELIHVLEYAITRSGNLPTLFPNSLPEAIRIKLTQTALGEPEPRAGTADGLPDELPELGKYREAGDRLYLEKLMDQSGGKMNKAAQLSGLSQSRLYKLIKQHGIKK